MKYWQAVKSSDKSTRPVKPINHRLRSSPCASCTYKLSRRYPGWVSCQRNTVRYTVKHLAEAYKRFLDGAGRPGWKRKFKDTPRFTVPDNIKIKGKKIYIPKMGWVKLTGKNPYAGCKPKPATFKYEAGTWYVSILYEVPAQRPARPDNPVKPVGMDRHVGQVARSTDVMYELPGLCMRAAKLRRLQKKLARQQFKSNGWQHTQLRIEQI